MVAVKITTYATLFLVPVITYIIGINVKKNPPKEINKIKGYRSALSMASQEAWDYANGRLGELMLKGSLYSLIAGVIGLIILLIINLPTDAILFPILISAVMLIQAVVMIIPTTRIEKELREEVYKNK